MLKNRILFLVIPLLLTMVTLGGMPQNAQGAILYGTAGNGTTLSTLYTVDTTTGATTAVGDVGFVVNGLEWYNGVLYGTTSYNDPAHRGLITIDPLTGAGTAVGSGWGESISSTILVEMAIDSFGNAYAWGEAREDDLYSIDLSTGTGSYIGDSRLNTATLGLAFGLSNTLYFFNGDGTAYTIDTTTGASSLIGDNVAGDEDALHHGDTDMTTGLYWGLDNEPEGGGSTAINIVNLATLELLDTLEIDRGLHTLAFAGETPVPVPGAVWLLGSGLMGLAGLRRKK